MTKAIVIDVGRCCGCYNCQLACKDEHVDNDWTPYAKPQPDTGQFWLKLEEHVCGTVPKVRMHYIPRLCNHCENPACLEACADGALTKREDGLVLIEPDKCTGCKDCLTACPYGSIYFNSELNVAQKCTGCAHLLDNGYRLPRCVESCPTDAIAFGEEEDLTDLIAGATVLMPETGARPRVYYRNIPGRFVSATVYDPIEKEVIIGARCRLTSAGKRLESFTDVYGDFWFNDVPVGTYDLSVEAKGFETKHLYGVSTARDVNLGDIPLTISA
jgi:tetrathionate reductase subunit B